MDSAYLGEIRIFAGTFAPYGFALCDGTIIPVNQNEALYSILGDTFGGNGTTTFALPDLRGRVILGSGQNPTGSNHVLGEVKGTETANVNITQLATHSHGLNFAMQVTARAGTTADSNQAAECYFADSPSSLPIYTESPIQSTYMGPLEAKVSASLDYTGGGLPHANVQPYLALTYIICINGIYPVRN